MGNYELCYDDTGWWPLEATSRDAAVAEAVEVVREDLDDLTETEIVTVEVRDRVERRCPRCGREGRDVEDQGHRLVCECGWDVDLHLVQRVVRIGPSVPCGRRWDVATPPAPEGPLVLVDDEVWEDGHGHLWATLGRLGLRVLPPPRGGHQAG
ncbi:MAG: hypothetical protein KatS3mg014_2509 [Actinomycetota bacterium]|nr:MAG: hypothetical protein KatS3mg014_2496 [Actinomycetota bacterium]GIV00894.1 MAG: hypothetical protein KatS3mg014_2509 [Actinomycetota bacterium]